VNFPIARKIIWINILLCQSFDSYMPYDKNNILAVIYKYE